MEITISGSFIAGRRRLTSVPDHRLQMPSSHPSHLPKIQSFRPKINCRNPLSGTVRSRGLLTDFDLLEPLKSLNTQPLRDQVHWTPLLSGPRRMPADSGGYEATLKEARILPPAAPSLQKPRCRTLCTSSCCTKPQ
eukprot:2618053-Rhodomonas_salina.2